MVVLIIVVVVAVLLVGGGVWFLATRERRGGPRLEPPPAPPRETAPPPPDTTVDPELVAEVEGALAPEAETEAPPEAEAPPEVEVARRPSFRERLAKARSTMSGYVGSVLSRDKVDDETWDELEEALIRADVGVATTTEILEHLREQARDDRIRDGDALVDALKAEMKRRLDDGNRELHHIDGTTNVWMFVGVNGVGKTTTIGKIGRHQTQLGRRVVMAAGDTFRAAAAEQLETWAGRADADFVRGAEGADPGAVVFDAVERAHARGDDLVLADTAGRLHTKTNLMEELRKVRRVAEKGAGKVTEVLLVVDATTGQNGLVQAREFTDAVDVSGIVLTKLDGSAKGGIVCAIQAETGIPVKLVGLGEGVEDLVEFDPEEFVEALFSAT